MKPKHQRLIFILLSLVIIAIASTFILSSFKDSLVFFISPTELLADKAGKGESFRTGGLVKEGSVKKNGTITNFILTDMESDVAVHYDGALPALFREKQGVVIEGVMGEDSILMASRILAKHDEKYMPPEVTRSLKESGHWNENGEEQSEGKAEGYVPTMPDTQMKVAP